MRVPDIGHAQAEAHRVVRAALSDRAAVLEAVADQEISAELASAYRESYRWLARRSAVDRRTDAVVEGASAAVVYGTFAVIGWLVSSRAEPDLVFWSLYVAGWFAGGIAFTGVAMLVSRLPAVPQGFVFLALAATAPAGGYLLWREHGAQVLDVIAGNWWYVALLGAAVGPATILLGFLPSYLVASWLLDHAAKHREPRTALLARLFELARALTSPRALSENRELLLTKLDEAALVLESGFYREVRLADPVSRATWRDRCRQCAQRLRSYDLWIVLPRRETRDDLLAEVATLIQVVVRGCLDELPAADPRPQRKLAVLASRLRGLLLGLIPLASVLGAQLTGVNLSGPVGGAWVVAATAWFALTLLTTFDSQAATRVSLLKDAADAVASFRGGANKP